MQSVKDENYFQIQGWMRTKLDLKGNELLIFAIIYGFSQDEESRFYGNLDYLSEFAGTSKPTTIKVLQKLLNKGLISREKVNTNHGICYIYQAKGKDFKSLNSLPQSLNSSSQRLRNFTPKVKKLYSKGKETLPNNKDIINNNNKDIINNNNKDAPSPVNAKKEKTPKHKYGEYENVLLSDDEYKKLVDKVGNEKADAVIKNFSELKEMKGYTYKSDYLALLKWGIRAYEEQNSRTGSGKNGRFNKESLADRDFFAGTEYEGATA